MLLYCIQHHGDFGQLCWLLRMLQHPDNQLLITLDGSQSDVEKLEILIAQQNIEFRRIVVRQSIPIFWCGPSQMKMLLKVFQEAFSFSDWKFLINLSGTCAPLSSQEHIFSVLQESNNQGIEAHLFYFKINKPFEIAPFTESMQVSERRVGRLLLRGTESVLEYFSDERFFPVIRAANRPFINCLEIQEPTKPLLVSRPSEEEIEFRKSYFEFFGHYCGRSWYILSEKAVEHILQFAGKATSESWRSVFLNTFEPDESFIQTALIGHGIFSGDQVSRKSFRAFEGTPRRLTDENISDIACEKTALFARKIDHRAADRLREWIFERVSEKI